MTETKTFRQALIVAIGEIGSGVTRNATNPHFKNQYADLAGVCALIKPILARHGLAVIQSPGTLVGEHLEITASIIHESGDGTDHTMLVPIGPKPTAQALGSAITYGRRYQLKALFGLADVDDDGTAASTPPLDTNDVSRRVTAAATLAELTALKSEVSESGDEDLVSLYLERRRKLKGT